MRSAVTLRALHTPQRRTKKIDFHHDAWTALAIAVVLAVLAAWLAYVPPRLRATETLETPSSRELPREWVWEKRAIDFDDMYRKADPGR